MRPRKPQLKTRAISLRKKGYSYNEICSCLHIAKSTCSLWLRGIKLETKAIQRLVDRQNDGRKTAAFTLRQYREERDEYIRQKVEKSLDNFILSSSVGKLLCAALYWGEGEKNRSTLAFTNSNPSMVTVYLSLLRTYFEIDNSKIKALLHLHSYHDVSKQKIYWSKITGIPRKRISIYQKQNSGKNIHQGYPGCISIRYYDVRLAQEMKFLYNSLIIKFGGVV